MTYTLLCSMEGFNRSPAARRFRTFGFRVSCFVTGRTGQAILAQAM